MGKAKPATTGRRKLWLFKMIAISLPFILLLLLELSLRIFGYGHDLSLFVTDPNDKGAWIMNPHASEKFFSHTADATVGNAEKFRKKKRVGTLRIFVLGESTTIGYPYMHNGSFHRMLQYRLLHIYPQLNTEIVNLSLTAVNSYTVLDFARQIVDYSPDAVLIYCGHNEYYGAMGVASTNGFVARTLLTLRGCRTWQLISSLYAGKAKTQDETLMRRMAGSQQVPYGSEVFKKGIEQFRNNMGQVAEIFSKHHIPVFISNLVSNERSMEPFISSDPAFRMAEACFKNGDFARAKAFFVQAKELDQLRFRAPEQMNEVIQNLKGVYAVNTRALFEKNSPGGIPGEETLLEHVHPNLFGYSLMCEAFFQSLIQHGILPKTGNMDLEKFRAAIPVTKVDSIKGAFEIAALKMRWPFRDTAKELQIQSFEEHMAYRLLTKQINWNNMLDTLMPYYMQYGNYSEALKVAESALLEYPDEPAFYWYAAKCCKQLHDQEKYKTYMQKVYSISKH